MHECAFINCMQNMICKTYFKTMYIEVEIFHFNSSFLEKWLIYQKMKAYVNYVD